MLPDAKSPETSQRRLGAHLVMSPGKESHCLQLLLAQGLVVMPGSRNRANKRAFPSLLALKTFKAKSEISLGFNSNHRENRKPRVRRFKTFQEGRNPAI